MKISNCCSAPIKENTDICSKCGEHCVEEEQDKAILRINDQEVELTKEQEREVQKILEKVYAEPEQSEEEGKEDWISEKMKEFDEIIKSFHEKFVIPYEDRTELNGTANDFDEWLKEKLSSLTSSVTEEIYKDLMKVADEGQYEDLRREISRYFK